MRKQVDTPFSILQERFIIRWESDPESTSSLLQKPVYGLRNILVDMSCVESIVPADVDGHCVFRMLSGDTLTIAMDFPDVTAGDPRFFSLE